MSPRPKKSVRIIYTTSSALPLHRGLADGLLKARTACPRLVYLVSYAASDTLDRRLAPRLVREQQREGAASDDERSRDVHRDGSLKVRIERNDGSLRDKATPHDTSVSQTDIFRETIRASETHDDTKDTRRRGGQPVARTPVFGREELRGDGVQDAVHNLWHGIIESAVPSLLNR